MIPYGLQNNIISLISHPKLLYFLKDIGCVEWGINIDSKQIIDEIIYKVNDIGFENWEAHNQKLIKTQNDIYNITLKNFNQIRNYLN